jgi:hypothetical protein
MQTRVRGKGVEMERGCWCLLFVLVGVVPAAAQVDQARAEQYFKEAQALCERDGGRLWGVSLCGPMVIADAPTGTIATSQPAPAGDRPRVLGFVNAPVQWGGITWSAYNWQMIPKDDQGERGRLFMHELFHCIQPRLGLTTGGSAGENSHLDSLEGRYWMRLEWRALARALGASGAARTSAIADALAFRAARHQRFPGAAEEEHAVDINEDRDVYAIRDRIGHCGGREPARHGHPIDLGDGYILRPDVRVRVWSRLRAVARRVVSRLASEDHSGERFRPAALSSGWSDCGAGHSRRRCAV